MNNENMQRIEALIFASPEPIGIDRLSEVSGILDPESIRNCIEDLNRQYNDSGHSFMIVHGGGGYRFATRPEYSRWVRKLLLGSGRLRLSKAALETLSIIAYRQPISRTAIESLRGVDSGGVLKMLLERKLIRVSGRASGPGRPLLYATTTDFLIHFGLNSLDDLPRPEELADDNGHLPSSPVLLEPGELSFEKNPSPIGETE